MDLSISDILESVSRAHHGEAGINGSSLSGFPDQPRDLQLLTRAWVSERVAPELLPYPTELMSRIMAGIRQQIETIEDRTARMDAGASFSLVIIQTELERIKFLVRSFLRARLAKIDAHSLHILGLWQSQAPDESSPLLSPQEFQYLTTHAALLERHYNASFLASFPAKHRSLEDRTGAGGIGMVEGPDLDKAVFIRCLGVPNDEYVSESRHRRALSDSDEEMQAVSGNGKNDNSRFANVTISCGFAPPSQTAALSQATPQASGGERIISMKRGEVWLVRWSSVRDAVARGECELV